MVSGSWEGLDQDSILHPTPICQQRTLFGLETCGLLFGQAIEEVRKLVDNGNYVAATVVEVRSVMELGLKEAKELVEKAPVVLKKGVAKEEADRIVEKLEAVGA
ncbi:hypothetical protein Droror1_Dr00009182 [Drosera rotundifolia]